MTGQSNDREELIRELKETRKQISELEEREIELVQVVGEDPFRPPDLHLIMFYAGPTGGTVWLPGISRFEFNRSTSDGTANGPEGPVPDFSWLRDYVHPEDFPAVEADLKQFAGGLVPAIYRRHRLILMGAMTVWMEFYALAIKRDEDGVPTEGVFCYRPIGRAGGVGSSFNQIVIRLFDLLDSVTQEDSPLSSLFESRYKETKDSSEALRDIWSLVTAIGTAEASRMMKAWDLSFVKDHSMRYVWVSDPFAKTLGLSLPEIQGRSDSELFGTLDQMEDEKTGEAVIRGVTGRVRRTRIVDGTPQMFHDTLWPIPLSCPDQARWIIGVSSPGDTREAVVEGHRLPVMVRVMDKALAVAKSDSTVLLTGESGSGKGHLAEEIHHQSRRAGGPFFVIDCAAIKSELFEAELFGHERGAYTGAVQKKRGLLALAEGGTVFLDEIGEVPLHLQSKLLRFLDKKSFTKLGGRLPESADVRIIAATNRNLEKEVQEGLFREDLYYRLNVVNIEVPPLREHLEDLRSIVDDILPRLCGVLKISPVPRIDPSEIETMKLYHWPGNIRELRNILERALLFSHVGKLTLREAMPNYIPEADEFDNKKPTGGSTGHQWLLAGEFRKDESQGSLLDHTERALIEQALEKSNGIKKEAARLLGVTWPSLKSKLKTLGMKGSK